MGFFVSFSRVRKAILLPVSPSSQHRKFSKFTIAYPYCCGFNPDDMRITD